MLQSTPLHPPREFPPRLAPEGGAPAAPTPPPECPIQVARPATVSALWEDLLVYTPERAGRAWWKYAVLLLVSLLLSSGFHVCVLYRFGALFHRLRLAPLCIIVEKLIYHLYHCVIPCSAQIGPGLWIPHPLGIVLSGRARLGRGIWLRQGVQIVHVRERGASGVVGDRARLNANAMLIKGAMIGEDSIVAAAAVVNRYVPPRHMAVGVPARVRPLRPEQVPEDPVRYR